MVIAGYSLFSVIGKALAKLLQNKYYVSVYDIGWCRSLVGFLICIFFVPLCGQQHFAVAKEFRFALMMRIIVGVLVFIGSEWVLKFLPLSIAFIIQQTQPFFTALLGFLMLGERIERKQLLIMIISYIGVFIIANA